VPDGKGFMSKEWDGFVPPPSLWCEVYRVLKPGGHALVFAGTRTQDLMTISLRLAGFEVRDSIAFLFFSGFPKSHNTHNVFKRRYRCELENTSVNLAETSSSQSGEVKEMDGLDSVPEVDSNSRSEEHTSELQSRFDLVCRLLLEQKKHQTRQNT